MQADHVSITRRALFAATVLAPAVAVAAPSPILTLDAEHRRRVAAANEHGLDEEECERRCDYADELDDALRAAPCDSMDAVRVKLRVIQEDLKHGRRTMASVDGVDVVGQVLAFISGVH